MTRITKKQQKLLLADISAFALSLWFMYSVISNTRDLIQQDIKNSPASMSLIVSIGIVCSAISIREKINTWGVVTLTILATSATIWLFGLTV